MQPDQLFASSAGSKAKRVRWKRWAVGIVALLLLGSTPTLYRVWDRDRARAVLDARVAVLRGAGEPVLPGDFTRPPVPDARNGAVLILHAADAIGLSKAEWAHIEKIIDDHPNDPVQGDLALAAKLFDENRRSFDDIAAARNLRLVDWKIKWGHPALMTELPHLKRLRTLTNLLSYDAWVRHHMGNDLAAMKDLSDILYLSRIGDDPAPLVSHQVCLGIGVVASARAIEVALALRVDSDDARRWVRSLIADFLDESPRRAAIVRTWQTERMVDFDSVTQMGEEVPRSRADFDRVCLHMMNDCDAFRQAALAANYPAALILLPKPDPSGFNSPIGKIREIILPGRAMSVALQFRELTERRVAAIALALRLYAVDHDGKMPESLSPLVPEYLPAVPIDPFAADDRPIAWRRGARLLYSVGKDGRDDGIADKLKPSEEAGDAWKSADAVFQLTPPQK